MSNEEIVALIQAGRTDLYECLWWQIERLIRWKANRLANALESSGRITFDDLYQTGYVAMVEAVSTYKPAEGKFTSWLEYYLKRSFAEVTGYRTKKKRFDPINTAVSLDKQLADDADADSMFEVIADPEGERGIQTVEQAIYQEQLCATMAQALDSIPAQYAEVLRLRYFQNMTLDEIGVAQGMSKERVRNLENKGIRSMRRPNIACKLLPFYDFNYYNTSLAAYRLTGLSVQERYLIDKERKEERERRNRSKEGLIRAINELLKR